MDYTVVVKRDPDGRYTACAPALDGAGSFGDTLPEALQMTEEAIALYVETLRERGWKVPQDNPRVEVDMTEASEVYVYRLHVREAHAVA